MKKHPIIIGLMLPVYLGLAVFEVLFLGRTEEGLDG